MRLVRISDLSEEERKKALEEQQARQEANRQASEQARQNANERFNELVSKRGEYDTSKHTTTINRLKKAYKGKSSYETVNNSLNSYYQRNKKQNNSMWNQIQNRAEENNRFTNNSRLMLYNNQNKSEGNILDNLRNWFFGNSVASNREKKNNIQENKEEKENKTILDTKLSKEKQTNKLTTFAEQDKILAPIKKEADIQEKNDNIWQDIAGVANLAGLGISSGSKEVLNYIENANENNFNNYENIKKQQFLTSPNVSEEDKAVAKSQDNLLLQKNGITVEQKIETNLVKKAIRDSIKKDEEKISDITSKISNKGMQKLADIAPSMGQMLPGTLLNAVNPILGTSYFMTSSGGSYIEDAKKRGMNDEQAFKYGTIMGILEGASESFITGQQVNKVSKALMGKEVSKDILNSYGFNMFENAIQEAVMEPAQEMTAGIVGGKDKADWSNIGARMAESGFNGALMGAITNGVTYGLEKSIKVYNKIKNKENVTPKEYKEALQENIDRFGNKAVEQGIRQGATETYQEINRINNSGNQSNLQNTNINQQQNQNNIDTTNMSFEDSAKAYNLDTNNETIKAVNQALSNRDIAGRFDANIFSNSNENAIWRTYTDEKGNTKREVIFNPNGNSQATMQQISIHELTHDLAGTKEFDELKNLVLDRNKKMQGYAEARQSLENTYSQVYDPNSKDFKSLVDDEEVADTLAQKLGDQEFVNSLSTEKPTVFKRIYDWVVDKVNKITGNKIEKVYWEDIKNKFENAYRQPYQGESNQTKYSFVGQRGLNNAIQQEPMTYMTIERGLNRAKQMQKAGIDNENIRQNTSWFQDKNGDWKFEISDKGMSIKDNIKKNSSNKLGNILNHNTLFTMYPELSEIKVEFKESKGISGNYNRNSNTITLSNNLIGNNEKLEKSIIHEIQHAIQTKEGFETGITSKLSRKAYYENLGEIEAEDVSKRFINEKYNNKNLKNIAPESSKANPKHRYYDQYMKKRGIVDKIKDSVFKYPKKDGNSNEINQESLEQIDKETLRDNDKQIWNGLNVPTKKLTEKQKQNRLEYLRNVDTSNMKLLEKSKIKSEIRALENGYNSVEEMRQVEKEKEQEAIREHNNKILKNKNDITENSNKSSFNLSKQQQLEIIQKTNPMLDDYHTGIRTVDNIKTFKEAYDIAKKEASDGGWDEYASYPDITNEMIENSLKTGNITVYSSNDIKNGTFVTPSYEQALEYAGNDSSKVKSKKVKVDDVAWINLDEGQYAKIDKNNNQSKLSMRQSNTWQEFLNNQIGQRGEGKTAQELKLPTKENSEIIQNKKIIENNNRDRLEKIEVTEQKDIITDKKEDNNKVEEEKIAEILTEIPTKEKEKGRIWAIFKANILDKGIVFEELSRKTNNRELQGKWDYTLTANARGQNAIGMPRYEFDKETKSQKQISKSLEAIREEVGEKKTDFSNYMYHQLNIDRMSLEERFGGDTGVNYERKNPINNKPVFANKVTAEISQEIVNKYEQNNPEFKEWAKDIYDFLDANTQELVKSGVISEDTRQLFKEMYPHYVPIARVNSKGNAITVPLDTGRTGINNPIKRAKGGNQDILPLFETIADRTLQTYRASARNNFGVELLNTLKTVQEVENVDIESIIEDISNTESNAELLKKGDKTTPPSFTVFDKGEKVTFEISKDMYDALKPISEGLAYRNKVLNKVSNFRRGVLTEYNPVFMITNSIKDIQDIIINSQHTTKTISKMPESYAQIIKNGYWYKEYMQNGGEQNSYFNANDGSFENDKKSHLAKNIATMPLRAISKVNNIIEMSPRLAEYIASREKGRSIETSMLDAARVTTNFKAGGNFTKLLNRNGATFLNASVQGAMQQVRNIQEAKVKGLKGWTALACKYAIAGLPAILLNNVLWDDDEDYRNLQDYVKDSYYCIAKYGDGKFIRIPKGRTVATIQKIVSNMNEYITDDKKINIDNLSKDFWEDLQFTMDNLAPNNPIDNNVISPIIQAVTNTSWYGEDIVPSRLQDKPKAEQYDETTDKFSKWLGEKLNASPYKINYLIDQYGGGISDLLLPKLTPQAENNMLEDKFTTDSVMKSKYPGEFFEKNDELNIKANSDKATDLDKVKSKYFSQISKSMNELYKEKREIENSNTDDETKKKQLKKVQKNINKLAETGIKEVDSAKVSDITANVGNELYYKYKGEWTKLTDEEKEKGFDEILDSYADYKNKVYETTEQKKDTGELEGESQLKEKDKLAILIDAKYSNEDKQKLYELTIGNDDDLYTDILQPSNINIDEYLKYKQQKFESDKEDDGTLEGKTVTNSKKKKVYSYVNNMNITYNQKLLILGKQYKLSDNEQRKLYEYINNMPGQTSQEKLEIFKKYSNNFEIYKNGTMSFK